MSLTLWDQLTDYFNHSELADNFTAIDEHDHTTGKGVQLPEGALGPDSVNNANLKDASITGNKIYGNSITKDQLGTDAVTTLKIADNQVTKAKVADDAVGVQELDGTVNDLLGVSESSTVRRGNFVRAAQDNLASATYQKMGNADEVINIAVPATSLLHIMYRAEWSKSDSGATATAAIFLDGDQLKYTPAPGPATAPAVQEIANSENNIVWKPLYTDEGGITQSTASSNYSGDASSTGQVVKFTTVEVDTGTYDVSVRFKVSAGTVSARYRSLYVWTAQYA
jgi:hypothetical protein